MGQAERCRVSSKKKKMNSFFAVVSSFRVGSISEEWREKLPVASMLERIMYHILVSVPDFQRNVMLSLLVNVLSL